MSRTLIYRTNEDFAKCTERLRNILNVQESRQDSKSSIVRKTNRTKQLLFSLNTRTKQQNNKIISGKSSFVKTNRNNQIENDERRFSYSPNKLLHSTIEDRSLANNHFSSTKSRIHTTRSPSLKHVAYQRLSSSSNKNNSLINNTSREKSFPSSSRQPIENEKEELIRSSSCAHLPSSNSDNMHPIQTELNQEQLIIHLRRIRTISKEIRARYSNEPDSSHLWNELERSLSSILFSTNHQQQVQLSLRPLHNEIIELRKQLQTTNMHFHESDRIHHHHEQYVQLQKKLNTNEMQCTQLLLHNEELKRKCYLLQEKFDHLERNDIRLTQRITEQDLESIGKRTEWISTDNHFLLREEIIFLRKKLSHVYDDLSLLFNRNRTLEYSIGDLKQKFFVNREQLNQLKRSAQEILCNIDHRLIQEKIKRFLNEILLDEQHSKVLNSSIHQTPIIVNSSSCFFERSDQVEVTPSIELVQTRIQTSSTVPRNKLRPKSLFITPTVLNDSDALCKLQNNRKSTINRRDRSLSSTIDDADSTITSSSSTSSSCPQPKRSTLHNSLPSLTVPITIDRITGCQRISRNESGAELDQISDLTSKMFGSGDEEDLFNVEMNSSRSSSSTTTFDAERLIYM